VSITPARRFKIPDFFSARPSPENGSLSFTPGELRRALERGYRNVNLIRKDPDLDPLRSRPDFQALLLDLSFPADPFARLR
jgi:hypothetical protein